MGTFTNIYPLDNRLSGTLGNVTRWKEKTRNVLRDPLPLPLVESDEANSDSIQQALPSELENGVISRNSDCYPRANPSDQAAGSDIQLDYSKDSRIVLASSSIILALAGVGLSVADRLLTEHEGIRVCLACRNKGRAENARARLLQRHSSANISIIIVDTSSVESVIRASEEIRKKFTRLDYIYLNAGVMKVSSINWSKVLAIFSSQGARILSTGWGVLNHIDEVTPDGLQEIFATNLFGHFVMVRELEDYLGGTQTTQIIWTSSQNANADDFSYTNIQHRNGKEPYASSKYATDVVSVALNDRLNKKGVYSVSTCPGLVMSNMTFGILPSWFWFLVMPFLFFMRLFVTSLTCNAYNAAEALIWISKQRCESLNSRIKYCSHCSIFGKPYVAEEKLNISEKDADNLYNQMEGLYQGFKSKYRNGTSRTAKDSVSNGLQNGIQNGFH
ncbi:3-keto-steroid reductase/17-beta-hydroxysteroid dehydrogenase 7-like [Mercenaria mercenaria]|uniref:3-keto-steroid reductase/17-beta-hydroxysteroid dehydrogenase 7-like n=1 Tax=Mercenaria mercenaria TaxID=6596 RepID=UPI00234EB484|nr:3-keto-steroid reductase/17-beta-hydroxysteroid dehydrogenase 7-like [Mercenaria mercenaria]